MSDGKDKGLNKVENTSYIFIPFRYGDRKIFRELVGSLGNSGSWNREKINVKYMLRYVADKISSGDEETCQCFLFSLNDTAREAFGIPERDEWCKIPAYNYRGEKVQPLFRIVDIKLFCFRTGVGIFAIRINLEKDDPFWVSNALFHLKKVSKTRIITGKGKSTFLGMAKDLARAFSYIEGFDPDFFFYIYEGKERANVLTFLTADSKDDFSKEMFYLRRCYSEGYKYLKNAKQEEEELHTPSAGMNWGVSPEAAVCIACPDAGIGNFLESQFFGNFNSQYLLMYVLLLHQKYVLYMYLTIIGNSDRNDLETLEDYKNQLYAFETDFVFSCITEVPQYQVLYDKIAKAFALRDMYQDVHEPILSLGEVRRAATEKEQAQRDKSLNSAILMLSLLSVFSALVDSFDFWNELFGEIFGGVPQVGFWITKVFQVVCIIAIIYIGIKVYRKFKES